MIALSAPGCLSMNPRGTVPVPVSDSNLKASAGTPASPLVADRLCSRRRRRGSCTADEQHEHHVPRSDIHCRACSRNEKRPDANRGEILRQNGAWTLEVHAAHAAHAAAAATRRRSRASSSDARRSSLRSSGGARPPRPRSAARCGRPSSGRFTPAFTRSVYSSVAALKPKAP